MTITRRQMLAATGVALALSPSKAVAGDEATPPPRRGQDAARTAMGVVIHSFPMRGSQPATADRPSLKDPLAFVEFCRGLGAGGVQMGIGARDKTYVARLRAAREKLGMYLEGSVAVPRDRGDVDRFEAEVRTAKECGVAVLRTAMLGSRRYETFTTALAFREFADRARVSIALAEPVVARHEVRLAIENHKDWRIDDLVDIVRRVSSRHVGICVDTGNSIALVEDPMQVVEAYAPWATTTHLKDMGVEFYDDGFLLSEVVLGTGFLDLKSIVTTLRKHRPDIRINLEMITRDPLRIPCLTEKYWATLPRVPARDLAMMLELVRRHASKYPLPRVGRLSPREKLAVEEDNVRRCLAYAREKLDL